MCHKCVQTSGCKLHRLDLFQYKNYFVVSSPFCIIYRHGCECFHRLRTGNISRLGKFCAREVSMRYIDGALWRLWVITTWINRRWVDWKYEAGNFGMQTYLSWLIKTMLHPKHFHENLCLNNTYRKCVRFFGLRSYCHWGRDNMGAVFKTTFSNAFSLMMMYKFRLRFHWSLFPRV